MRRDIAIIGVILILSSYAAVTANLTRHGMDWLRPVDATTKPASQPEETPVITSKDPAEAEPAEAASEEEADEGMVGLDFLCEHMHQGDAFVIDAREAEDFEVSHIRDAILLPNSAIYKNIDRVLETVPLDAIVIVYCNGGGCDASHNVAHALRIDYGYTNVVIHEKGWEEVMAAQERMAEFIVEGAES